MIKSKITNGDMMKDKIYEEIKEKNRKTTEHYMRALGIIDSSDKVKSSIPKKNIDLGIILSKLNLIELNEETSNTIDEFHDYVFKLGIDIGVGSGKKLMIEAIQQDKSLFEDLMEIDPQEYVNYPIEPAFIEGIREVILDEK